MSKYVVIVKKIRVFEVIVEAETREQARELACVGWQGHFNEYIKKGRPLVLEEG